ncbi:helix-turn-helix domain-containing protein [Romboutsia sp.]|uniref:helix-turn-helix domain-containing protein n=1 Tax=Romboutsia sp. TaxID=1965302 RepID=UPI003F2DDD2E
MNDVNVSQNILKYRKSKNLTIKDLASLSGVTSSLLSQIEKGTANPSLNTIKSIASVLEVPLFNFFVSDINTKDLVVRADSRKKMTFPESDSFSYELLSPNLNGSIEFMMMKIPQNAHSSDELMDHKGEEVAYVTKGSVHLYLMNDVILLNTGDSIKIPPHAKHKWVNEFSNEAEVVFAVTPPSF